MQLTQSTFQTIKGLTAINDHGHAYLKAAQALGEEDLAQEFASINHLHALHGHLPMDLYNRRYLAYQNLMAKAKSVMATEDYQKFYMLF